MRRFRQRWVVIALNVAAIDVAVILPLAAVGPYLITRLLGLALQLIDLRGRRH